MISRFPADTNISVLPIYISSVTPNLEGRGVYDWCSLDYLKNPWDQATVDFRPSKDESQMRKNRNGSDILNES